MVGRFLLLRIWIPREEKFKPVIELKDGPTTMVDYFMGEIVKVLGEVGGVVCAL